MALEFDGGALDLCVGPVPPAASKHEATVRIARKRLDDDDVDARTEHAGNAAVAHVPDVIRQIVDVQNASDIAPFEQNQPIRRRREAVAEPDIERADAPEPAFMPKQTVHLDLAGRLRVQPGGVDDAVRVSKAADCDPRAAFHVAITQGGGRDCNTLSCHPEHTVSFLRFDRTNHLVSNRDAASFQASNGSGRLDGCKLPGAEIGWASGPVVHEHGHGRVIGDFLTADAETGEAGDDADDPGAADALVGQTNRGCTRSANPAIGL